MFENCTFSDNVRGDDMLNCFHAKFKIKNCAFNNVLSDAFDSDFSSGTVAGCSFSNVGNDGVDCSGSTLEISETMFTKIGDKAISAGENSTISISNNTISESAIGFVAKDGSKLMLSDSIVLENNDLDFAVFMKKVFYDYPSLTIQNDVKKYSYLFQKGAIIIPMDTTLVFVEDVESKLYGKEYGKASK